MAHHAGQDSPYSHFMTQDFVKHGHFVLGHDWRRLAALDHHSTRLDTSFAASLIRCFLAKGWAHAKHDTYPTIVPVLGAMVMAEERYSATVHLITRTRPRGSTHHSNHLHYASIDFDPAKDDDHHFYRLCYYAARDVSVLDIESHRVMEKTPSDAFHLKMGAIPDQIQDELVRLLPQHGHSSGSHEEEEEPWGWEDYNEWQETHHPASHHGSADEHLSLEALSMRSLSPEAQTHGHPQPRPRESAISQARGPWNQTLAQYRLLRTAYDDGRIDPHDTENITALVRELQELALDGIICSKDQVVHYYQYRQVTNSPSLLKRPRRLTSVLCRCRKRYKERQPPLTDRAGPQADLTIAQIEYLIEYATGPLTTQQKQEIVSDVSGYAPPGQNFNLRWLWRWRRN